MAFLSSFSAYVPPRVVTNSQLASRLNCSPEWITEVSGIEERRYAANDQTVTDMAVEAAQDCLRKAGLSPSQVGMLMVSSGSSERRFPGPACQVADRLGLEQTPALDIPLASAGSLFALALASQLTATYGNILIVAAEKMSAIATREPLDKNTAMLFGDGAGACLVSSQSGSARIIDSVLHSDGSFADSLYLGHAGPLQMNGLSVILQAARKIPSAIHEVLDRNSKTPAEIDIFLMHQANQNLINRVARSLEVPSEKFYCDIRSYGNTSSASMLIVAASWWAANPPGPGSSICFASFGAGFHWGALLAEVQNKN